jgi:MarR family transcriptional regulator, negative regulator of the multidrug operon emrRAB
MRKVSPENLVGAFSLAVMDAVLRQLQDDEEHLAPVLVSLLFHPGLSIRQLSNQLGLSHPATVRLVDRMENDRLLARKPGGDARSLAIVLSGRGEARAKSLLDQRAEALTNLLAPLSHEERANLSALLSKVLVSFPRSQSDALRTCRLCDERVCAQLGRCPVKAAVVSADER